MLKLPKVKSQKELEVDFQKIQNFRDLVLFKTTYYCGLRISEALKLTKSDIDLKKRILKVLQSKRAKDRLVPIPKPLISYLEFYLKNHHNEKLFNISRNRAYVLCKQYFGFGPHSLRHSYCTHIYEKTGDIHAVKELAGHSNISTTQIYTHLSTEGKTKIIEEAFK